MIIASMDQGKIEALTDSLSSDRIEAKQYQRDCLRKSLIISLPSRPVIRHHSDAIALSASKSSGGIHTLPMMENLPTLGDYARH